ncbi:MAG TPA: hypothetical protein VF168_10605 [Trueperaceae bacterium]
MALVNTDSLEAHIYCYTKRIFGLIHPTPGAAVAEFLNRGDRSILPVTNALVYRSGSADPPRASERIASTSFYAVPKEQILWIRSGYYETGDPHSYDIKQVTIFFDDCIVTGDLRLVRGSRLSDHLERTSEKRGFQRIYNAVVTPTEAALGREDRELVSSESEVLTVNLRNAQGVSEAEGSVRTVERAERHAEYSRPK